MKNILYCVLALTLLAACAKEPEPAEPAVDIAAGKAIVEADCSGCHGMDGRGADGDIPNLAAQPAEYLIDAMHAYHDGRRQHAALRERTSKMSESDISNIAGYYASLPPLETLGDTSMGPTDTVVYNEGSGVAAVCEKCHGKHGNSTAQGIPNLAGQQPAYLIIATQEYKDGSRGHVEKEEMLKGLKQVDIEKMAMYFAAQVPEPREAPPFGDPVAGEPLTAVCGECHGALGISHDPMVPSLAGQEPYYLVNAIKAYRSHARTHEDMVTDKSDQDFENIAAFYAVQKAEAADDLQMALREVVAKCDRCHGPAVGKRTLAIPSLKGQNHDYLIRAMKAYRGADRGNSMMHKMSVGYSDEMIEAVADHYADQSN